MRHDSNTPIFSFRNRLIEEYSSFSRSFVRIAAPDIRKKVDREYEADRYWPEPLIQINPFYKQEQTIQDLAATGHLHPLCGEIFRRDKAEGVPKDLRLYTHQLEALALAKKKRTYVVTTSAASPVTNCATSWIRRM